MNRMINKKVYVNQRISSNVPAVMYLCFINLTSEKETKYFEFLKIRYVLMS